MYKKLITLTLSALFLTIPLAKATLDLRIDDIPPAVDAETYTLHIITEAGAKVTVTGGPNEIPPVTDSDNDGEIEITIGLSQNIDNQLSIRAEKETESSETLQITIKESKEEAEIYASISGKDLTPPNRPILDNYEEEVNTAFVYLTGIAEDGSTVIASKTDGTQLNTTTANEDSIFSLKVNLEQNKRNRINVSARDKSGNTSLAIQAVIVESDKFEETTPELIEDEEEKISEEEKTDLIEEFKDIENHWAKDYIQALKIAEIVEGKGDGRFAPDELLTRAELTKIALNAFNINAPEVSTTPFDDVDLTDWFAPYVIKAEKEGIVSGYNDGFRPNQNITRAEAVKILLLTAGFEIPKISSQFEDSISYRWYDEYLAFVKNNNIISGYSDGTFRPEYPITRGEIAKITIKIIELYNNTFEEKKEYIYIPEVPVIETEEEVITEKEEADLIDDNRLYENQNFNFSLQFYKNWYYESATGSGDTILTIGFSTDEDTLANAVVKINIKKDSLETIGETNLTKEQIGNTVKYYLELSDSRHVEIYGDEAYAEKIQTMAETFKVTN